MEAASSYLSHQLKILLTCKGRFFLSRKCIIIITYFDADATDVGLLATSIRQQDVLGLQVTVDDSFAVEDAHGGSDLLEENPQCVFSQRPLSLRRNIERERSQRGRLAPNKGKGRTLPRQGAPAAPRVASRILPRNSARQQLVKQLIKISFLFKYRGAPLRKSAPSDVTLIFFSWNRLNAGLLISFRCFPLHNSTLMSTFLCLRSHHAGSRLKLY